MTGLLEREHELARVAAVLGGATGGTGCTIHVEGSAGIGKTSLLGRTAEMARASGYTVLTASGGELEVEFSLRRGTWAVPTRSRTARSSPAARATRCSTPSIASPTWVMRSC